MSRPPFWMGQLQERDDETDAVQSLPQAAVAASAVEDASQRTWTQARQLMREYYPTNAQGSLTNKGKGKGKGKFRGTSGRKGRRQNQGQGPETGQANLWGTRSQGEPWHWTSLFAMSRDHAVRPSAHSTTNSLGPSSMERDIARSLARTCSVKTSRRLTHQRTAMLAFSLFSVRHHFGKR